MKLLKAGFTSKRIEELYIKRNNLKTLHTHILYENVKFDMLQDEKTSLIQEITVEIPHFLCKIRKKAKLNFIPDFVGLSFVLLAPISNDISDFDSLASLYSTYGGFGVNSR